MGAEMPQLSVSAHGLRPALGSASDGPECHNDWKVVTFFLKHYRPVASMVKEQGLSFSLWIKGKHWNAWANTMSTFCTSAQPPMLPGIDGFVSKPSFDGTPETSCHSIHASLPTNGLLKSLLGQELRWIAISPSKKETFRGKARALGLATLTPSPNSHLYLG